MLQIDHDVVMKPFTGQGREEYVAEVIGSADVHLTVRAYHRRTAMTLNVDVHAALALHEPSPLTVPGQTVKPAAAGNQHHVGMSGDRVAHPRSAAARRLRRNEPGPCALVDEIRA
ncbi:hypothetical protein [Streptomyces lavendulae]